MAYWETWVLRVDGFCIIYWCFQRWQRTWLSQLCLACTSFSSCQTRSRWRWRSQAWCCPWIVKRGEVSPDTEVWGVIVGAVCWGLHNQPSSCTELVWTAKGVRLASHIFLSQTLSLVQAPELDIEATAFPVPPWRGSAAPAKLHGEFRCGTDEHRAPSERFMGGVSGREREWEAQTHTSPMPYLVFLTQYQWSRGGAVGNILKLMSVGDMLLISVPASDPS